MAFKETPEEKQWYISWYAHVLFKKTKDIFCVDIKPNIG